MILGGPLLGMQPLRRPQGLPSSRLKKLSSPSLIIHMLHVPGHLGSRSLHALKFINILYCRAETGRNILGTVYEVPSKGEQSLPLSTGYSSVDAAPYAVHCLFCLDALLTQLTVHQDPSTFSIGQLPSLAGSAYITAEGSSNPGCRT